VLSDKVGIAMKKLLCALILSTFVLASADSAHADVAGLNAACGGLPAAPAVTSGETANIDAMNTYSAGMRAYSARLMTYLTCLDNHSVSTTDLASPAYRREVITHRRQVADQLRQSSTIGDRVLELHDRRTGREA